MDSFDKLNLKDNLLRGIYAYGFENPSGIQQKAIPLILEGKDVIAQAQSGTGKTGAFAIAMLEKIDENLDGVQCIVLTHTRELAIQVNNVISTLGMYTNIKSLLCIGGSSVSENIYEIKNCNPKILVCTPGRLLDFLNRSVVDPNTIKNMIIDEADEILGQGFKEQTYRIMKFISPSTQICIFSATYNENVMDLTSKFMNNPEKILVNKEQLTLDGIKQYYVSIERREWKFDILCDLYNTIMTGQSIIYSNYRKEIDRLERKLLDKDFAVSAIHGGIDSRNRKDIMNKFRKGDIRVLLSTDLLARGIDVQNVSIIINYDLPFEKQTYIHRIGRSGRYGRKGLAINLVTNDDKPKLKEIEEYYNTQIEELPEDFNSYMIK